MIPTVEKTTQRIGFCNGTRASRHDWATENPKMARMPMDLPVDLAIEPLCPNAGKIRHESENAESKTYRCQDATFLSLECSSAGE